MLQQSGSIAIAIALFTFTSLHAQQFDSAVVHIGVDDVGGLGISNIVTYLQLDGRFSSVGNIDVDAGGVPTVGQLSAYDSVLIVTDNRAGTLTGGGLGTQLGNVLDDYVVGGGRVVLSTFAKASPISASMAIFLPFRPTRSEQAMVPLACLTWARPRHPILCFAA